MLEGLQLLISEHPTLTFFLIIFLAYVNFIMVKLIWQGRVVPIYNRPFPWTWNLFVTFLKTDAENAKIVAGKVFPWWRGFLIGCVILIIAIIPFMAYCSFLVVVFSLPKTILAGLLVFNHIFG